MVDGKLGPRACRVCGPRLEGCYACSARFGHHHLQVIDRRGVVVRQVAACEHHGPALASPVTVPHRPSQPLTDPVREAKRRRDRERRAAQRAVLDRHADEVAAELERIRQEGQP